MISPPSARRVVHPLIAKITREIDLGIDPPVLKVLDRLSQFLSRVEHTGLHSGGRNAENLRALRDRLLVIVNKVDDLSMLGREPSQRFSHKLAAILLQQRSLGIIRRIDESALDLFRQLVLCPASPSR